MTNQIVHQRGPKVIHDHQTCFACRPGEHKPSFTPYLTPGILYQKCSLVVRPEEGCEPLLPLTSIEKEKDRIVGVIPCDVDLTNTVAADNCPITVYTNIGLDPNYVCWPAGSTEEQIDMLVRNLKDCIWFINRFHCSALPDQLAEHLDLNTLEKSKLDVKTSTSVPSTTGLGE